MLNCEPMVPNEIENQDRQPTEPTGPPLNKASRFWFAEDFESDVKYLDDPKQDYPPRLEKFGGSCTVTGSQL